MYFSFPVKVLYFDWHNSKNFEIEKVLKVQQKNLFQKATRARFQSYNFVYNEIVIDNE